MCRSVIYKLRTICLYTLVLYVSPLIGRGQGSAPFVIAKGDTAAMYYQRLAEFRFNEKEAVDYEKEVGKLRKQGLMDEKNKLVGKWRNWIGVKAHQGTVYAYYPCDFFYHYRCSFNDSTFISWSGDGPEAFRIKSFWKKKDVWGYVLVDRFGKEGSLEAQMLDRKQRLFMFSLVMPGQKRRDHLMVESERLTIFPLVVNYCADGRKPEIKFDERL